MHGRDEWSLDPEWVTVRTGADLSSFTVDLIVSIRNEKKYLGNSRAAIALQ